MKKYIFIFQTKTVFLLLGFLMALINTSCRKELDNYSINYDKQIVINGFITPDSIVKINVAFSFPANINKPDTNDIYIDDAICLLYENNLFIDTLNYTQKGFYLCDNFKPKVNDTYKLIIKINGFNEITATTSIPEKVNLSISNIEDLYKDPPKMQLTIKDTPGDSYFMFNILQKYTWVYENFPYYSFYNPDMGKFVQNEHPFDDKIFTDTKFKNKTYILNIKYIRGYNEFAYFWLTSMNKDLYLNLKSKKNYDDVKNDIFAEPVNIYSNINGGLGIFAGYNRAQDSLFFASK